MPRIPILRVLRISPFDKLLEHAQKLKVCIEVMRDAVTTYCDGKYEESEKLSQKVIELEHEADLIKGNITAHLPKGIFLPVDMNVFLRLLHEQDAILDFAEDAVVWSHFRKTKVPEEIKGELLKHLYKVLECIEAYERTVIHVKEVISLTGPRRLREKIKETVKEVHRKEWEDDQIERELAKKIFNLSIDPLTIYHLLKLSDLIGKIATHAENAADRIRAMIAQ